MPQHVAETVYGRSLHLQVCHLQAGYLFEVTYFSWVACCPESTGIVIPFKRCQFLIQSFYRRMQPYGTPLWTIETWRCGCDSVMHVICHTFQQPCTAMHIIGTRYACRKFHVGGKGLLHLRQRGLPLLIVIHQPVQTNGTYRRHSAPTVNVRLQRTARADTYYLQVAVTLLLPFPILHSQRRVKLRHHYVYIVATHTCRKGRESCPVVSARKGMKLSVVRFKLNLFENPLEHVDPVWVTNKQHLVCQGAAV